jgi:signal transduction histidine kinase
MTRTAWRLTLINGLILVSAVALMGLAAVPARAFVNEQSIDSDLIAQGESVAQSAPVGPRVAQPPAGVVTISVETFAERPVFVEVATLDGTVIMRSANLGDSQLPLEQTRLARALGGQAWFENASQDGHALRCYDVPVRMDASTPESPVVGLIEVASPLNDDPPSWPVLAGLVVAGVLGALGVGWLLARIALAPVEQLARTVDSISSTEDLGRRVPVGRSPGLRLDAVDQLGVAFNAMLERLQLTTGRLEEALAVQRQFVGDASHQLRTPLTSVRGNVQLLSRLCAEDCPGVAVVQHQAILGDLDGETERMSRLVDGLLVLARADAQQHLSLSPTPLEPLLRQAYRTARGLSEHVSVDLDADLPGVLVNADPDRLLQLLMILLDNAVRYTPPGGHVWLRGAQLSRHGEAGVVTEIVDSGPGVPVAERTRIFERFYRTAQAQELSEGAGLGLAMARWIADEHQAELSVDDAEPHGSIFRVWLPTVNGC